MAFQKGEKCRGTRQRGDISIKKERKVLAKKKEKAGEKPQDREASTNKREKGGKGSFLRIRGIVQTRWNLNKKQLKLIQKRTPGQSLKKSGHQKSKRPPQMEKNYLRGKAKCPRGCAVSEATSSEKRTDEGRGVTRTGTDKDKGCHIETDSQRK